MKKDYTDPKYTAYALDELSAQERAAVEREVQADPGLEQHVAEIQAFAGTLKTALAQEPELELDASRRATVRHAAQRRPAGRLLSPAFWRLTWLSAAAAAVVLMAAVGVDRYRSTTPPGFTQQADTLEMAMANGIPDQEMVQLTIEVPPPLFIGTPVPLDASVASRLAPVTSSGVAYDMAPHPAGGRPARVMAFAGEAPIIQPFLSPSLDDFPERTDHTFLRVTDHPLSTFSIDVDTASYAIVRRFLNDGQRPPKDAVRVEELINYFPYDYAQPEDGTPFAVHLEAAPAPWNPENHLVRIALKGYELAPEARPPMNLVFLIDVSGSMYPANRLPLVKRAMQTLARQLDERDQVAIVVYSGAAGMVLPPTRGDDTQTVLDALERLTAGGSTAGGAGIQLAYETAQSMFEAGAVNRVILCTDGDFNVGISQRGDLERLIEEKAQSGVFLSVLGFGMGNLKDSTLELLSNKGNGNYAYIDDFSEARKVLVDEMLGTLVTIAKDVKIQVEFNPAHVAGYRLIGYENRLLNKEDFNNDAVDAGDIGAGHTVTAFYEIIPAGRPVTNAPEVDPLRYQTEAAGDPLLQDEVLTVKLRYKQPDGDTSALLARTLETGALETDGASRDFRFAAAVSVFGQLLRGNDLVADFGWDGALGLAESALDYDPYGHRAEFIKLLRNAQTIGE